MNLSMSSIFKDYYQRAQNIAVIENAIFNYTESVNYITPADVADVETQGQIQQAIAFIEAWLKEEKTYSWLLWRVNPIIYKAHESLAKWYAKIYLPQGPKQIGRELEINFASGVIDSVAEQNEARLHHYFRVRNAAGIGELIILREIRDIKSGQKSADIINYVIPIAHAFF